MRVFDPHDRDRGLVRCDDGCVYLIDVLEEVMVHQEAQLLQLRRLVVGYCMGRACR